MLNIWIEEATQLFATVDIEADAEHYVTEHQESLGQRLNDIIAELSHPQKNERSTEFLALSEPDRLNFAICTLTIHIQTVALRDNLNTIEKMTELRGFLNKHFKKTDIGGFLAALKSDSLRLMGATESLGRTNLSESLNTTAVSYEALLLRMKYEALHPRFMQALYTKFSPGATLLTPEQQRLLAKDQIRQYLVANNFKTFSRVPLEYNGVTSLIGTQSVLSLFMGDTQDDGIPETLINLVKTHPILVAISKNPTLPKQDSLEQILKYIEIFSVLINEIHSTNFVVNPVDQKRVSTLETTPKPETLQLIEGLSLGTYEIYETTRAQIRCYFAQSISNLSKLSPNDLCSSISIHSLLDQYIGKTLARVFDLRFSPIIDQDAIEQEQAGIFENQVYEFYALFSAPFDISLAQIPGCLDFLSELLYQQPKIVLKLLELQGKAGNNVGHTIAKNGNEIHMQQYLFLLQALTERFPYRILSLLQLLKSSIEHMAINSTSDSIKEKYHALIVNSLEKGLDSAQDPSIYQPFREQLAQSLIALPLNQFTLILLQQFLKRENAIGKFLTDSTSRLTMFFTSQNLIATIKIKISTIEEKLEKQTNPKNSSPMFLASPGKSERSTGKSQGSPVVGESENTISSTTTGHYSTKEKLGLYQTTALALIM